MSRSLAASSEVRYSSPLTQFRAFLSLKPKNFPNLGLADVPGSHLQADLSRRATDRLSITSFGAFDRFNLTALQQTIGFTSVGLHYSVTKRFALLGGADWSSVQNPTKRSGTIEGFVFLDPEMNGVRGPGSEALPDISVTLDDGRTARTDRKGAYAFEHVAPGPHRVVAQLPASPRAFFTTPTHSIAKVPARIDFGLVWAAARIDGRVISDAGIGIPGVVLSAASRNGPPVSTTSDAEGRFVFALTPGTFRVSLSASSLPAGYSIAGQYQWDVAVEPDQPRTVPFDVQAVRTIAGLAPGASEVQIESLEKKASVNAEGKFLLRSLPSGTFTITAHNGGRTIVSTITLPPEPANVRGVVLATMASVTATSAGTPVSTHKEASSTSTEAPLVQHHGIFLVQAGAFREKPNAAQLLGSLQRNGDRPFIVVARGLTLVCIGPYETHEEAMAAREHLLRGGFDGWVTRR